MDEDQPSSGGRGQHGRKTKRRGPNRQIEENGTLRFDRFETDLRDHIANHPGMYAAPAMEEVDVRIPEGKGDHAAVYRDLHNAIWTGVAPRTDGRDGRMSLELANAMILSGHTLQPVSLPLDRGAYSELLAGLRAAGK